MAVASGVAGPCQRALLVFAGNAAAPVRPLRALLLSLLACGVTTIIAGLLLRVFDLSNVVVVFLLMVVLVALRWGRAAGALAALVGVVSFDFFFVPPVFSFHTSDTQYLFTFTLTLVVALVIGQLAARLRSETRAAVAGERRATALARVAGELSAACTMEQITSVCTATIAPLFASGEVSLLPGSAGGVAMGHGGSAITSEERQLLDACRALVALSLERVHFAEVARDTQVRMEGERLRHALLAAVSHDLRTPLTAIRGLAEILEANDSLPRQERDGIAQAIHHQADGLHRLVTNLLDLARMQSHGVKLSLEWYAVSDVVGSALAGMGALVDRRAVLVELEPSLPLVAVDACLFERVLVNLLDNAMKYTTPATTIWIKAWEAQDTMHVCVDDDGAGLPAGVAAETLFAPFARGVRESAIAGVGLGLALCRSIVEAHGGTIMAARRKPRGMRFEVRLPVGCPPDIECEAAA